MLGKRRQTKVNSPSASGEAVNAMRVLQQDFCRRANFEAKIVELTTHILDEIAAMRREIAFLSQKHSHPSPTI
jgi:ABC-type Na+ transport system ATPase subunit NatA